jgi:hypothetical protein
LVVAVAAVGTVAFATGVARADDLPGTYDIKLDDMANDCSPPPVSMKTSTLRLEVKADSLLINIPTIPQMAGVAAKGNKVNAKTPKVLPTTVQGLDGRYTIAGRLRSEDSVLDLVLVAEYSVKGKPYCTQSWHVLGSKQTAGAGSAAPTK